jgi:N utilization substance protein B
MDDALAHHARQEEIALVIEPDEIFENDPERDAKLTRRRLARERVLQVLYARSMNGKSLDELYVEFISSDDLLDEPAKDFAAKLLRHFSAHEGHINDVIKHRLEKWDFSRVALIDKILLEIGIAEFLYFPEIPPKATINELIEIAKDFSTDESGKFINGILHRAKDELANAGELNKEGRGLIDHTI